MTHPFLEFVHFNRYIFANVYGISVFVVTRNPSRAAAESGATSGTIPSGYKLLTGWLATQHWSDARYRGSEAWSSEARSSEAWSSEAWSSEAWSSEGALNQEG